MKNKNDLLINFNLPRPEENKPEIFELKRQDSAWCLSRRDFIKIAAMFTSGFFLQRKVEAQEQKKEDENARFNNVMAHLASINALAISPDEKLLISGSADNTIKFWSLPDGALMKTIGEHKNIVHSLYISSDGRLLVSGSRDKTIKLWSLPHGRFIKTLEGHTDIVYSLAITPDNSLLVSGSADKTIKLWSLLEDNLIKTLEGHSKSVNTIAITPDGKLLVSGSADRTIKLWSLPEGNLIKTFEDHGSSVKSIVVSPDGKVLASGDFDGTIKLWSLPDGVLIKTNEEAHDSSIKCLIMSWDGKILISGSNDTTIKLWSSEFKQIITGHILSVNTIAITSDGKLLISGSQDNTIRFWAIPEVRLLACLMDIVASPTGGQGRQYKLQNKVGEEIIYTLPAGLPLPSGAVCSCNYVYGSCAKPMIHAYEGDAVRYSATYQNKNEKEINASECGLFYLQNPYDKYGRICVCVGFVCPCDGGQIVYIPCSIY